MAEPNLSLPAICDELGIDCRTGRNAIKQACGLSYRQIRRNALVHRLKRLIAQSPAMPVKEMSRALGFASSSGLRNFTKATVGCAPSALRRRKASTRPVRCSVLILASLVDPHADAVTAELSRRNMSAIRIDGLEMPASITATIGFGVAASASEITVPDGTFAVETIASVWNRRPRLPNAPPRAAAEAAVKSPDDFAVREVRHFLPGLLGILGDRPWINNREAQTKAELKPVQLAAATAVGLRVPQTIMTNDPRRCLEFAECVGGEVIYKPFGFHMREEEGDISALYTRRLRRCDLLQHIDQVRVAPCIFQEFIPKRVELRVTAIGGDYFTLEIDTSRSETANVDWRHYDLKATKWNPGTLPRSVQAQLDRLMFELGLVFGCIDLIVTPEGEYVFLEVNPAGQWLWVEKITGFRMVERLVDVLASRAPVCAK